MAAIWLPSAAGKRPWWVASALGMVTGIVFFQIAFSWLWNVTILGTLLLNLYMALYFGLWGGFAGWLVKPGHVWTSSRNNLKLAGCAAASWVAQEYLRGVIFTGFGWNGLGVALWKNLPLIQIADITGVAGISFLIAFTNAILFATVVRFGEEIRRMRLRPHFDFTVTMALIGVVFVYGVYSLQKTESSLILKLSVVQANIPQIKKWDRKEAAQILKTYEKLSLQALAYQPQLLLWPEAATPGPLFLDNDSEQLVIKIGDLGDFDMLLGTLDSELTETGQKDYNIAVLVTNRAKDTYSYQKIHLVPFGEYVPCRFLFGPIIGDQVASDFDSGTEPKVFEMKSAPIKLGPLICFEDTVPELTRQFVLKGAELLVNLTNDGWFKESAGSKQHLRNAVFRAVENRRPMVRAANTGVSCTISTTGRIEQQLEDEQGNTFISGVLNGEIRVPIQPAQTVYTRFGDWFSYLCLFFFVTLSIWNGYRSLGRKALPPTLNSERL